MRTTAKLISVDDKFAVRVSDVYWFGLVHRNIKFLDTDYGKNNNWFWCYGCPQCVEKFALFSDGDSALKALEAYRKRIAALNKAVSGG